MTAAVETIEAPPTRAVAVATIKSVALAKVREAEPVLRALAEKYRAVVYDLKTAKGLAEAKAARHDLRENGRYAVQRAEQAVRDEANAVKKEIAPEAERLIAIIQPLEDDLDKQIKAREAEIEAEKEAARAAEAARREKHERAIASIRSYVEAAKGRPAANIAIGIERLSAMTFGDECEDFLGHYTLAHSETLVALQKMHDEAKAREDEEARLAAQRAEQERISAELAEQKRQLEEQAAAVAKARAELEAQQRAAAAAEEAPAPDTSASAGASPEAKGTEVTPGHGQPEASPLTWREALDNGLAVFIDADEPRDTSTHQEAGQAAAQGTEANPSPCQAQTSSPGRHQWGVYVPQEQSDPAAIAVADLACRAMTGDDAALETTEAEARPWSPSDAYLGTGAFHDTPADIAPGLEELAHALLEHIATAFEGRFPSHPKPSQEWWQFLKVKAASLQAHLNDEVLPG